MNIMVATMAPVGFPHRIVEPLKPVERTAAVNPVRENPVNHENEEGKILGKRREQEKPQLVGNQVNILA